MRRPGAFRAAAAAAGVAAGLALGSGPSHAQPAPVRPLTAERAEALHAGMLQLLQLERSGDRPGAIRRGEELLRDFPDDRRVEDALLNLYRGDKREESLARLLGRRLQRDPNDLESLRELVVLDLARNAQTEAVEAVRRCIAANPRDENRYRLGASLLRSRGLLDPALQIYRDGRRAIGGEARFAGELAQIEEERGDYAAAIGEYLLLLSDPDQHERARRQIANLLARAPEPARVMTEIEALRLRRPRSAPIQDVAATAYLQAGRLQEALAAVGEADRYAGDQGEYLLDFGRSLLQPSGGEPADAERARIGVRGLQLLSERHPDSNLIPEATKLTAEGLVSVAREQGDPATRQELLQQAVAALDALHGRPRWAQLEREMLALKAMILFEDLGQPAEALAAFEQLAKTKRPGPAGADRVIQVQVGLCYAAMGKLDTARRMLHDLVAQAGPPPGPPPGMLPSPHSPRRPIDIGVARARFHLADLDLIEAKYDTARTQFADLAADIPDDRLANDCLELALTLLEAGSDPPAALARFGAYRRALMAHDRDAARAALEALVRENPESALSPVALYGLAVAFTGQQRYPEALARYDTLLAAHPEHRLAPRALEAIGDLEMQHLGRPDLAVASYERLLTGYAGDLFLDDVRKKLLSAREAAKGIPRATP